MSRSTSRNSLASGQPVDMQSVRPGNADRRGGLSGNILVKGTLQGFPGLMTGPCE